VDHFSGGGSIHGSSSALRKGPPYARNRRVSRSMGRATSVSTDIHNSRNAIERTYNRLKDFRRIASRYNHLTISFKAAVCITATVNYW
jgi:hypothetical protein